MSTQYFFYKTGKTLKKIDIEEILLLEASDNYVKFHGPGYEHLVRTTLDAVLDQLPEKEFVRIHRTFAAPIRFIEKFDREFAVINYIINEIPVSKKYYRELINKIVILDPTTSAERNDDVKKNGQR